jgi:nitrite reductase/ring-hydroxylating ferredoxin subunit
MPPPAPHRPDGSAGEPDDQVRGGGPDEHDTGLAPDAIDPERPRVVETPWGTMALFSRGDEVLCVQAFCPHLGGPLFQGTLQGDTVTCPWHLWRFDLRSGERVDPERPDSGPDARGLARCAVRRSARGTLVLGRPAQPL